MLEQKKPKATGGTIGSIADFTNYRPPIREAVKPKSDKGPGFIFVGNDTWLPRHLVNARKRQQRNVSHVGENGIVWTR